MSAPQKRPSMRCRFASKAASGSPPRPPAPPCLGFQPPEEAATTICSLFYLWVYEVLETSEADELRLRNPMRCRRLGCQPPPRCSGSATNGANLIHAGMISPVPSLHSSDTTTS